MAWWLVAMPRPFVRPGHTHPDPLPPRGRGDSPSSPPVLGSRFRGMGLSGGFCLGSLSFCEGRFASFAVLGPFTNGPYGVRSCFWLGGGGVVVLGCS